MNKTDYKKKIIELGLGMKSVTDMAGYCNAPYISGCFQDRDMWTVYENDERGANKIILQTNDENEAFQVLYDYMVGKKLLDEEDN